VRALLSAGTETGRRFRLDGVVRQRSDSGGQAVIAGWSHACVARVGWDGGHAPSGRIAVFMVPPILASM
jgi:hypothetical protein